MTDEALKNDNIPNMIVPMILHTLRDHLQTILVSEVPDSNPTRALLVKVGRFQDNPLKVNVSVSISGGDFEDPAYMDGRMDHTDMDQFEIRNLPVGEIGGGIYWWRRGTVNVQCFFVRQGLEEDVALQYAYDFYGRLMNAIETADLGSLEDDYGEKACGFPYIEGSTFFESGGSNKYIWRGKLKWRVLTWRP